MEHRRATQGGLTNVSDEPRAQLHQQELTFSYRVSSSAVAPPAWNPLKTTVVFDSYWRLAAERQRIFFARSRSIPQPWTSDPILREHKFTNAYRASDRVSQYLIRKVIYGGDQSPQEIFFRTILFKFFNRIETWELLISRLGELTFREYRFEDYDNVLSAAMNAGERIYSAAYIMPSGGRASPRGRKHQMHLRLLERMVAENLPERLAECSSMRRAFELLRCYPTIGDFLAYQYVIDLNYGPILNLSEMEFVCAGPGAKDGIRKCFSDASGLGDSEIIRLMAERQEHEFARLGIEFKSLWGRRLQLIDCQNLFCEVDKYARIAHPEVLGLTGRTRIKQKFRPIEKPIPLWYPPKWGINEKIENEPRMFVTIEGSTADAIWLRIVDHFRRGSASAQSSRAGDTDELLHAALCLHNPRERWVVSRHPALSPAFALAEVVWILRGRQDSAFLNYFNRRLPEFAGRGPIYHGAYGFRLRNQFCVDQLRRACEALKTNPDSRQVVLQIWDARTDLPAPDGSAVAEDIPCSVCAFLKIRGGCLDWTQIMRSNDVFRGLPFNIVQFTSLQEIVSGWLRVETGQYHHLSDSLHLYSEKKADVLTSSKIEAPPNSDSLYATYPETEIASQSLERLIELIIDTNTRADALLAEFDSLDVPPGWRNIAAVLLSEGCRRRAANDTSRRIMDSCSNALFCLLVQRWADRIRSK